MANAYPYDEYTRKRVARAIYDLLPLFYRVQDQPPEGFQDLQKFLQVWSAPLATVRQSIDETHANFFIDTCGNAALSLLAQLVGTTLIFPDADTNRRDLRGTISRRERKGTRPMLEELARDLTEQLATLLEGWQLLTISENLNLQRPERTIADTRPITFGSSASGPLDTAQHLVDIRTITDVTGRYHPRDVTYWVHVTRTSPFQDATPTYLRTNLSDPDPLDPTNVRMEWRYAFHPLGIPWALRQRPASDDDQIQTDRIYADHFSTRTADFFGVEGRFVVRIAGLPAGVAAPVFDARNASTVPADLEILTGDTIAIELLNRPLQGWESGVFELSVGLASPDQFNPDMPDPVTFEPRASLLLGAVAVTTGVATVAPPKRVLLRLQTPGHNGGYFPGATVSITASHPSAARASVDPTLALQGFLRGALVVTLPATWVVGTRWFYLAADGSVFDAQSEAAQLRGLGEIDVALVDNDGVIQLDIDHLASVGPGAAWPPLAREGSPNRLTSVNPPPGRGANILHGGTVLTNEDNQDPVPVDDTTQCALVFALRYFDTRFVHKLIGRLSWSGPDPKGAVWQVFAGDADRTVITDPQAVRLRLAELVDFRNQGPNHLSLGIRFECSTSAIFTPGEVAWSSDDGETILLYLMELEAPPPGVLPDDSWPTPANFVASDIVEAHDDGSTLAVATLHRRLSEGQVAPLRGSTLHLRRRVKWASLIDAPVPLSADTLKTAERCLSVDVERGEFALYGEAPQPWPAGPVDHPVPSGFARPPNVTVRFEDAYTANLGAHPTAREQLLAQLQGSSTALAPATRIVSRSGTLDTSRDPQMYAAPIYTSLRDALAAIAAAPADAEVVQIQDDSTYPDETLVWPSGVHSLTVVAADSRRPVLLLVGAGSPPQPPVSYRALTLRGLAFGGVPVTLPTCDAIDLQFCTVTDTATSLTITFPANGVCNILRSVTAGLKLDGAGILNVTDSIIDAGTSPGPTVKLAPAIERAPNTLIEAEVRCEHSTIYGTTDAYVLNASECIFVGNVAVADRFHGCVRFCALPLGSVMPRHHQVVLGVDPDDPNRPVPTNVELANPKFLSLGRNEPTHMRLAEETSHAIRAGAQDGSELGAFNYLNSTQRFQAFESRLRESTPAGLAWALLRVN